MTDFTRFVPLSKMDKSQQMVFGYASTPALDLDGEIVSLSAIKSALPGYMAWGNIREMHRTSAVGVAKEATMDDKGLWLGVKVVDPVAWQKCLEGVYKGFSIGGQVIKKSGKTIDEMELIEISLVDRPANPECRIEVVKREKDAKGDEHPVLLHKGADLLPVSAIVQKMAPREDDHSSVIGKAVGSALRALGFAKGEGVSDGGDLTHADLTTINHEHTEHGQLPGVATALPNPEVVRPAGSSTAPPPIGEESRRVEAEAVLAATSADRELGMGKTASPEDLDGDFWKLGASPVKESTMTTQAEEIAKRVGAAVRMQMSKAKEHMGKAAACQGKAMESCGKAAEIAKSLATTAKAASAPVAADLSKSAADMMTHLHEMHGQLSAMADHHDLAAMAIDKAAGISPDNVGSGASPWGPAPQAVQPKEAAATGVPEGYISKAHADEITELKVKAAAAEARADTLSRMPASINKARTFEIGKAAEGMPSAGTAGKTPQELLLENVTVDMNDPDSRTKAAGRMIGNMIGNAGVFGKNPALDPTFRGGAG